MFHLAALFANQNSIDHPERDLMVNGLGTLRLFEFAKRYSVKRVLYTSSSCVYGNSNKMVETNQEFRPDTLCNNKVAR